jgi:hypothetical protein
METSTDFEFFEMVPPQKRKPGRKAVVREDQPRPVITIRPGSVVISLS